MDIFDLKDTVRTGPVGDVRTMVKNSDVLQCADFSVFAAGLFSTF
jgi:hypothetical protein